MSVFMTTVVRSGFICPTVSVRPPVLRLQLFLASPRPDFYEAAAPTAGFRAGGVQR